ncbi:MAG: selenide, water dikinase SelD [Planctomycetes bacterium RBG_13_63_9]|nr:MAG: selenide, water dikinase SelD [Planctomycetes bacterium RBG_13_63_9]
MAPSVDPRLLVGPQTFDDGAVLAMRDDLAICFTADFITPVVDDPRQWGRIAAANSISDVYAMGGQPLAALNLVCWSNCLPPELLAEVLAGGASAAAEAGCIIAGGHTLEDKEPKYGMAVIGTIHPDRILRNQGALPGDLLYLSKPLGTGILATAIKAELAGAEETEAAVESMSSLNRQACEAAIAAPARALTDVTGFGLAGHLTEMLGEDGHLGADLFGRSLPRLPGVDRHMEMGMIPGGAYRNRDAYSGRVRIAEEIRSAVEMLLYDPQTSGGLLAAIPPDSADRFEQEAADRGVKVSRIGRFSDQGLIKVVP